MRLKIEGSQSDIEALHAELAATLGLPLTAISERPHDPLQRTPLGLEPWVHFFIAVGAHLTAMAIHDAVKGAITALRQRRLLSDAEIMVGQEPGSSGDTSKP